MIFRSKSGLKHTHTDTLMLYCEEQIYALSLTVSDGGK